MNLRVGGWLLLLTLWCSPSHAEATKFYAPPSQFNANLQVMELGFANLTGLFREGTASFSFDAESKTISRFRMAINAASLVSTNPRSEQSLAYLIGSARSPEISFVASEPAPLKDDKAVLKGNLTLNGISKPAELAVTLNRIGKSPYAGGMWNSEGEAIGLSLRTTPKLTDFSSEPKPAEETPRFGDTITLTIEIQASAM